MKEPDSPRKQKLKAANSRLRTKVCRLNKKASQKKSTTIAAIVKDANYVGSVKTTRARIFRGI